MARHRDEIRAARKQFARTHDGRQRDLPARRVAELCDRAAEAAQNAAESAIADASILDERYRFALPPDPNSEVYDRLVKLFVLSHPDFRAWLTERVKEVAPTFTTDMTIAEYQKAMAGFEDELAEAEAEDRRGPLLAERALIDEQLQAIEQKD
jgi:hypothetical protein